MRPLRHQRTSASNDQGHVLFARKVRLFALPQGVVYRERIDRHGEVFGVHLRKALTTGVIFEELIEHHIIDLARPSSVKFDNLLVLGPVTVQGPELATRIPKQHQEVFRLGPGNLLQYLLFGIAIYRPREDTVLDGIEDDAPIRLGRRLFVKLGTIVVHHGTGGGRDITGSIVEAATFGDQARR